MEISKIKLFSIYKSFTILCLIHLIIFFEIYYFDLKSFTTMELYDTNKNIDILFHLPRYLLIINIYFFAPAILLGYILLGRTNNFFLITIVFFIYLEFLYLFIGSYAYLRWHRSTTPAQREEYCISINKKLTKRQLWYYILNLVALCCPILLLICSSFGFPPDIFIVSTLILLTLLIFFEIRSCLVSVTREEKKRYRFTVIASVACLIWNAFMGFYYVYLVLYF